MKITVEDDKQNVIEFELTNNVGNQLPIIQKALREAHLHGRVRESRHLKNVKHVRKSKPK